MTEKLKTTQLIHLAICAGVIILYIILGDFTSILNIPQLDSISIIYLVITGSAVFSSSYLYKSQVKNVDEKLTLEERIPNYQTATIIRLAMLEGAAFVILFLIPQLIILGILIILYMIYLRPTEDQFKKDFAETEW